MVRGETSSWIHNHLARLDEESSRCHQPYHLFSHYPSLAPIWKLLGRVDIYSRSALYPCSFEQSHVLAYQRPPRHHFVYSMLIASTSPLQSLARVLQDVVQGSRFLLVSVECHD